MSERNGRNGVLNSLVRSYFDVQRSRIALGGRISAYDRGAAGPREDRLHKGAFVQTIEEQAATLEQSEQQIAKSVELEVGRYPLWTEWLSTVKGCGPMYAAVILTSFDIEIATTVSKMWQFAGLNPGMVRGMKAMAKSEYKSEMGDFVREFKDLKGKAKIIVRTHEMVRGDRRTPGFLSPFNGWLRTQLCGKLGPSFLKAQSPYAIAYYYPLHVPVARRGEFGPGRLDVEENVHAVTGKPWKDEKEGHRARAANRYMIKAFLRDLYVAWRTLEGLEVRPPYAEEYLGHRHAS